MKRMVRAAWLSAAASAMLAGCGGISPPQIGLTAPPPPPLDALSEGTIDGYDEAAFEALRVQNGTSFASNAECIAFMDGALRDLLVDPNGDLFSGVGDVRLTDEAGDSWRSYSYGTVTYGSPLPPQPGQAPQTITMKAGHTFRCQNGLFSYVPPPPPP